MAPTNEAAEVPAPLPRQDNFTEDCCCSGMAVFEVEGVIFRVPKFLFKPGPGKFKPLLFNEKEEDKGSGKDPIPLPDLTAAEFQALIDFFFPYRWLNRKNRGKVPLQYWVDLLSVSSKYQLGSIRLIAIQAIDEYEPDVDPVEKYVLATKYMVKEWEKSSFKILCRRSDPPTVEDAKKLGVVTVTEVFREREKFRSKLIEWTNLPRDLKDGGSVPSKTPQSEPASTASAGPTATEPVADPTTATSTSFNKTTAKPTPPKVKSPKAKLEPSEEEVIFSNPQPGPSQPNKRHPTNVRSSFPPPFRVPVSEETASGTTSFFGRVTNSDVLLAVKPAEMQKSPRESTLPLSASQSKFTFKQ